MKSSPIVHRKHVENRKSITADVSLVHCHFDRNSEACNALFLCEDFYQDFYPDFTVLDFFYHTSFQREQGSLLVFGELPYSFYSFLRLD